MWQTAWLFLSVRSLKGGFCCAAFPASWIYNSICGWFPWSFYYSKRRVSTLYGKRQREGSDNMREDLLPHTAAGWAAVELTWLAAFWTFAIIPNRKKNDIKAFKMHTIVPLRAVWCIRSGRSWDGGRGSDSRDSLEKAQRRWHFLYLVGGERSIHSNGRAEYRLGLWTILYC